MPSLPSKTNLLHRRGQRCYISGSAMKFQKGILSDEEEKQSVGVKIGSDVDLKPLATTGPTRSVTPPAMAKDRLFETQEKVTSSSRHYLVVLAVVAVVVLGAGIGLYLFLQPGIGDQIATPKQAEAAVRDHFLTKEKRTATDMTFYKCDGYLWARVGVETRNDIPNPLMKIGTYRAKVGEQAGSWQVSEAGPIDSPDKDTPCR